MGFVGGCGTGGSGTDHGKFFTHKEISSIRGFKIGSRVNFLAHFLLLSASLESNPEAPENWGHYQPVAPLARRWCALLEATGNRWHVADCAIPGWVLRIQDRSRSRGHFCAGSSRHVEPSSPDRDAIPSRRNLRMRREVATKVETCFRFCCQFCCRFAIFSEKWKHKWKQISTSEASMSNDGGNLWHLNHAALRSESDRSHTVFFSRRRSRLPRPQFAF